MRTQPVVPHDLLTMIDAMDGREFENVVGQLFVRLGHTVRLTEHFDWGADLIVGKDGAWTVVQVKRWGHRVGDGAVRAALAAREAYRCNNALVVTNSEFTPDARTLARAADVTLWDRLKLARQIQWFCARCGERVPWVERHLCLLKHQVFGGNVYCRSHRHA